MTSNFPTTPDTIPNNVNNQTPEYDTHPGVHNQLADAVMAVELSLLAGGSLSLSDHVAASDPHPVYLNATEGNALITAHTAAADPHPVYLTQTEGDVRYAPVSGGGYLTQVQGDARYLQLAGGTLTGNLLFSTDNTFDIGASGATRPRTLFLGTSLVTPQSDVTTLRVGPTLSLGATPGAPDVFHVRELANTLAQRNGTSPQTLRLYSTYTDASNYDRFIMSYSVSGGTMMMRTEQLGTGGGTNIELTSALHLYFGAAGAKRWWVQYPSGHLLAYTDNSFDIGQSASNRPRSIYLAGGVGFYGTAATTKQTVSGSRGGNAALASLLTALAAYGFVTDSSTA